MKNSRSLRLNRFEWRIPYGNTDRASSRVALIHCCTNKLDWERGTKHTCPASMHGLLLTIALIRMVFRWHFMAHLTATMMLQFVGR